MQSHSSSTAKLIRALYGFAPHVVGERWMNDALDLAGFNSLRGCGLEVDDILHSLFNRIAAAACRRFLSMYFVKRLAGAHRLLDQSRFGRVEQVDYEIGMLAHDFRPKLHGFSAINIDFPL